MRVLISNKDNKRDYKLQTKTTKTVITSNKGNKESVNFKQRQHLKKNF